MKPFTLSLLILFTLLNSQMSSGQDYNFYHLTTNEGLPSAKVNSITQDNQGFMYFATSDGLVRYDGVRMNIYRNNPDDSTSIAFNKIKILFTDKNGAIWCGHDKYGVSVFNPLNGKFSRIPFKLHTHSGKFNGFVSAIGQCPDGKIYVSTFSDNQSAFLIDPQHFKVGQFFLTNYDPQHLLTERNNNLLGFCFYSDTLWLAGTLDGLVFYNPVKKIVRKILKIENTDSESWKNFMGGFISDKTGDVYIGSWAGGLHKYNINKGMLTTFTKVENATALESCSPKYFINDSLVLVVGWAVYFLNTNTGKIRKVEQDILNKYAIVGNASDAFRSSDGTIWLSTLSGVNYFNPRKNEFRSKFLAKDTERIAINPPHEQHWIYFDAFTKTYIINYFNKHETKVSFTLSLYDEHFNHLVDIPNPVTNRNDQLCYTGNHKGKLYFSGTGQNKSALYELNVITRQIKNILMDSPFQDSLVISNLTFDTDTLLVVDLEQGLLLSLSATDFHIISALHITKPKTNSFGIQSRTPVYDGRNKLFWLFNESGLYKMNTINPVIVQFKNANSNALLKTNRSISAVVTDRMQRLWFAHPDGISCLNLTSGAIEFTYGEKDLPSLNTLQLFCDSSGDIWSDCSKGLVQIDYTKGITQYYNSTNGLQPLCYPGTADFLSDGSMIIPFPGGLVLYNTKLKKNTYPLTSPFITGIRSFDKDYKTDTTFSYLNTITWPYHNNSVTIDFASMNFTTPDFYRYAYMLEGLNNTFSITTSPSLNYTNLEPGNYVLHLKSSADGKTYSPEKLLNIVITPPWYRTWIFRLLMLGVGILIIILAYQIRINQVRKEEQVKTVFNRKLMGMEMTVLRSQMNPHFIFNSLNSINRYVMQNDRLTATDYIAKFGKLMRNVLDNSMNETITLKQELNTLELYIQLEKLRFEDKFTYTINVDDNIEDSTLRVPPLLLQPFVENSIWHGFMHKAEKGNISIHATLINPDLLEITIEDNGIGREKAMELKNNKSSHQSHGIQVTKERIKIINELNHQRNKVEITDLYNSENQPAGTRVSLSIPIKHST